MSVEQLEYLLNYARFASRNQCVPVPDGTTGNEAFHNELEAFFWCVRTPTRRNVESLVDVIVAVKFVSGFLQKQKLTKQHTQSDLLRTYRED